MDDSLNLKLKKLKAMSGSVKRRAQLYSDLSKVDDKKTAQSLGALNKAPAPRDCPKWMIKKLHNLLVL